MARGSLREIISFNLALAKRFRENVSLSRQSFYTIWRRVDGVAMTEGVIVLPFFIIVWLGIFSLHHYYLARLDAQNSAASIAYSAAQSGNCSDEVRGASDMGVSVASNIPGDSLGILTTILGDSPLAVVHVRTKAVASRVSYGQSQVGEGKRILLCNSKPVANLLDLAMSPIKKLLGMEE